MGGRTQGTAKERRDATRVKPPPLSGRCHPPLSPASENAPVWKDSDGGSIPPLRLFLPRVWFISSKVMRERGMY